MPAESAIDLVTGGAGFIGSHLLAELARSGRTVRVVDDLSSGDVRCLEPCADRIEFVQVDLVTTDVAGPTRGVSRDHPDRRPKDRRDHPGADLRRRARRLQSIFIRKALAGEPITIQGSGSQGRQFTHARDIGRAFEAALTKGRSGSAYNIVADRMVSIRELAELVTKIAPTEVRYGEARPGDVPSALVANDLAKAELGWAPTVDFEDGLRELVDEANTPNP